MMLRTFKYLLIIGLAVLQVNAVIGQETVDLNTIKRDFIEDLQKTMKKQSIVGASIVVVSKDDILWHEHLGFADKEKGVKVSKSTLYALGSVTKVFTAAAVMQLQDQGKVYIDRSLSDYLPQFQIRGEHVEKVTPRNILSHHSGLPSDVLKGMFTTQPEDYKELVNYINSEHMAGIPNQIRAYSNPGYTLLGHMVKEVSGTEYPQYLREHLLNPLDMHQSGFDTNPNRSNAYNAKGDVAMEGALRDIPAGGLWSTTTDMAKFMMAYLSQSDKIMSKAAFSAVMEPQHLASQLNMGAKYGLGWSISKRPHTGQLLIHTGTTQYFNAALVLAPEAEIGVVILTNSDKGGYLFSSAMTLLDDFARSMGREKAEAKADVELGNKKRIKTSRSELEEFAGYYVAPGAYMKIYTRGNRLFVKIQGIRAELLPVGDRTFILKPILLHLIPIKLNDERVIFEEIEGYQVMTSLDQSGRELIARKFEPKVLSKAWTSQLGEYSIVDQLPGEIPFFKDFSLTEDEGLLVLSFAQVSNGEPIKMVLETITDSRAKVAGLGRYAGQSVTIGNGGITAFGLTLRKNEN